MGSSLHQFTWFGVACSDFCFFSLGITSRTFLLCALFGKKKTNLKALNGCWRTQGFQKVNFMVSFGYRSGQCLGPGKFCSPGASRPAAHIHAHIYQMLTIVYMFTIHRSGQGICFRGSPYVPARHKQKTETSYEKNSCMLHEPFCRLNSPW